MKLLQKPSSTQVIDPAGRLISTYGTVGEAQAFVAGYEMGKSAAVQTMASVLADLKKS